MQAISILTWMYTVHYNLFKLEPRFVDYLNYNLNQ